MTLLVNDDKEDKISENVKIVSTKFKPKNRFGQSIGYARGLLQPKELHE